MFSHVFVRFPFVSCVVPECPSISVHMCSSVFLIRCMWSYDLLSLLTCSYGASCVLTLSIVRLCVIIVSYVVLCFTCVLLLFCVPLACEFLFLLFYVFLRFPLVPCVLIYFLWRPMFTYVCLCMLMCSSGCSCVFLGCLIWSYGLLLFLCLPVIPCVLLRFRLVAYVFSRSHTCHRRFDFL